MICPNCNTNNPDNATFCAGCGAPISAPAATVANFCTNCGAPVPAGCGFCPACGTKIGSAARSGGDLANALTPVLKKTFTAPLEAVDDAIASNNVFVGIISIILVLVSTLIAAICITADLKNIEAGYIIAFTFLFTVLFTIPPFVGTLVGAKINKADVNATGIFNSMTGSNIYTAIFVLVSGISALIDPTVFFICILFAILYKAYSTISVTNHVAGNIMGKASVFFATVGTSYLIKLVTLGLIYAVAKDAIQSAIMHMLFK